MPKKSTVEVAELKTALHTMMLIRKMEIQLDELYKQRHIRGFLHLYDGQEAVITGFESALTKQDHLTAAYRNHGMLITRGIPVQAIVEELLGKKGGWSKGKGGSMHFYSKKKNFYGGHGIVGAQIPVGTGVGFGLQYDGNKTDVSLTFLGDGACNQGQWHESTNMAMLWKLPVIYVIENNKYGMGTSVDRASANTAFYTRGDLIPGIKASGNSFFEMREVMAFAKKWALANGPIVIEAETYRYHGHSMSDPGTTYRNRDEVSTYRKQKDCIETLKRVMLENKAATEKELEEITSRVNEEVSTAIKNAMAAPLAGDEEQLNDIWANDKQWFRRGNNYEASFFPEGQY